MDTTSSLVECFEVRHKNGLYLVEWKQGASLRRAWIRGDQIGWREGKRLGVTRPDGGIPYGVDWSRLIGNIIISSDDLDSELKRNGIWTTDDLRANPQSVFSAIQGATGVTLGLLINAAKEYDRAAGA